MDRTPGPADPEVTAVIVGFEQPEETQAAIESALRAGCVRVVVWDNSQSAAAKKKHAALKSEMVDVFGDGTNHGFGGGNNRAVQHVETQRLLLLNPDCAIDAETLRSMQSVIDRDIAVGVVAPRMRYPDGTFGFAGGGPPSMLKELVAATGFDERIPRSLRRRIIEFAAQLRRHARGSAGMGDSVSAGAPVDMCWVSGFCMLVDIDTYQSVGGFDEDFFLYFEDVDLCERISSTGRRIVLDRRVSALHRESTSTGRVGKSAHYWAGLSSYYAKGGKRWRSRLAGAIARRGRP